METTGKKTIEAILENERINANQLAEAIGLARTQPIYDIINGKVKRITPNYANKILTTYPNYNYNWLLTGEGEMLKANKIESNVHSKPENDYMMVEYVDLRASAGVLGGADVQQLPETHKRLVPKEYAKGKFLVVGVDGDSMNDGTIRSLADGDEVLVYQHEGKITDPLPIKKTIFVITTREGNVMKQIVEINDNEQTITCRSFNALYPDFTIAFSDIYQIFIVCKIVQKQIRII